MITENSINVKLNGYYGTWQTISELKHNENIAYLLQGEDRLYEQCRIIVDENGKVLVEDGNNLADFIKYLDDIEFYTGGKYRRR